MWSACGGMPGATLAAAAFLPRHSPSPPSPPSPLSPPRRSAFATLTAHPDLSALPEACRTPWLQRPAYLQEVARAAATSPGPGEYNCLPGMGRVRAVPMFPLQSRHRLILHSASASAEMPSAEMPSAEMPAAEMRAAEMRADAHLAFPLGGRGRSRGAGALLPPIGVCPPTAPHPPLSTRPLHRIATPSSTLHSPTPPHSYPLLHSPLTHSTT